MTIEEAIYCLKSYMPDAEDDMCKNCKYYGSVKDGSAYICKSNAAREMAIEALEKQVPKEPEYEEEDRFVENHFACYAYCPQCGCEINTGEMHCTQCGQAIDWKEEG